MGKKSKGKKHIVGGIIAILVLVLAVFAIWPGRVEPAATLKPTTIPTQAANCTVGKYPYIRAESGLVCVGNITVSNGTGDKTATAKFINITFTNISGKGVIFDPTKDFLSLSNDKASGVQLYNDTGEDGTFDHTDKLVSTGPKPTWTTITQDKKWNVSFEDPDLGSKIGTCYLFIVVHTSDSIDSNAVFNVSIRKNDIVLDAPHGNRYKAPDAETFLYGKDKGVTADIKKTERYQYCYRIPCKEI